MLDHLKQIVIIFYFDNKDLQIRDNVDGEKISKILDKQNCRFEILTTKNNTAIITIPEYRIANN